MSKFSKTNKEALLPRKTNIENMFNTIAKLSRKMARIEKGILRQIKKDSIFNNLTSLNQSYSF
jgi:hypothetical protein